MRSQRVAELDRRVAVLEGSATQKSTITRISDLRSLPYVVFLGEPGIGKTTVLENEAKHDGVQICKVRQLITGSVPSFAETLFLDALDEYRMDGSPSDKAYNLAQAISSARVSRWRLTCRSEDWRKEADIESIRATTNGSAIVVVQILPLELYEAHEILASLGEKDPDLFLTKAADFGAGAFAESPLSLQLLYKAVADKGAWPSSRFELFENAINYLSYERNKERNVSDRKPSNSIVAAAGKICFLLLASGARSFWRSNDEPPTISGDNDAYLTANDLDIESALLKNLLDTALFRGEGESFEVMHRTIAEYLAGQALAGFVVPNMGKAALPLSRALALITCADGHPPTELRGLYAWFAAHLAKLGDETGAKRLIENDAVTVLTYGDAAVFSSAARRKILMGLSRNDPYFRSSEVGITSVGGLAGEDLADDFKEILTKPSDDSHRLFTVLEVLTAGAPVKSVRPILREVALTPGQSGWVRWRSADAWLNGAVNLPKSRRELFDATAGEIVSISRESLRMHLIAGPMDPPLSFSDIKNILVDYQKSTRDNAVGRLFGLKRLVENSPFPELFDVPLIEWLPRYPHAGHKYEVEDLLDTALASSIRGTPDLSAKRLWLWIVNYRKDFFVGLGDEASKAVVDWLKKDVAREVELFDVILSKDDFSCSPALVVSNFIFATKKIPSIEITRYLLRKAECCKKSKSKRLLEIAVALAKGVNSGYEAYWETYAQVSRTPGCVRLLRELSTSKIEGWRYEQLRYAEKFKLKEKKKKRNHVAFLQTVCTELSRGGYTNHLDWAAQEYFRRSREESSVTRGIGAVIAETNMEIASAIVKGWEHLATHDFSDIDAVKLGIEDGKSSRYWIEFSVIAGLSSLIENKKLPEFDEMSICVALIVLKSGWIVQDAEDRAELYQWAIEKLSQDLIAGAQELSNYWIAAVSAGSLNLSGLENLTVSDMGKDVLKSAIKLFLLSLPNSSVQILQSALGTCGVLLKRSDLKIIVSAALLNPAVEKGSRRIWEYVAFAINPMGKEDKFPRRLSAREAVNVFDCIDDRMIRLFDSDGETGIYREAFLIRNIGSFITSNSPRGRKSNRRSRADEIIRNAINFLASNSAVEAGEVLTEMISNAHLMPWRAKLSHALAQHRRLRRDHSFAHSSSLALNDAIRGGVPVNASDLRAIAIEELQRFGDEMHTGDNAPWKRYWNTSSSGAVTEPKIENLCRDHLLDRLRDRLVPYKIMAALPEVRRGEETRADIVILTAAGRNLPIEVKRHYNSEVWESASTQLQGYASDLGADGFGIYLVFWFGNDVSKAPKRKDGKPVPGSAVEMQRMLIEDLTSENRATTDVVVFDVSNPNDSAVVKVRKK